MNDVPPQPNPPCEVPHDNNALSFFAICSPLPLDLELPPGDTLFLRGEMMKIAEVSERYAISADTLRYYERIGLIPTVNCR
jgi:hypothetical protein